MQNPPATTLEDNVVSLSGKIKKASQRDLILKALQEGRKLTHLDALRDFGIWSLAPRIFELRRQGYQILSEMIEVQSGKKIAVYWIVPEPQ